MKEKTVSLCNASIRLNLGLKLHKADMVTKHGIRGAECLVSVTSKIIYGELKHRTE